jgi:hypothetical protein
MRDASRMNIRSELLGPFESPPPEGDLEGFIDEMRGLMEDALAKLRKASA